MRTTENGIAMLEAEEGVVLRAYRCPAGVWTIGAGLTAASGVVKPRAGMVITAEQARTLLVQAVHNNYEPAVLAAMRGGRPLRNEVDAGVMFHFNTGGIGRASWVKAWLRDDATAARKGLMLWIKGGGKVLPGLVKRREREADLLLQGVYALPKAASSPVTASDWGPAHIALPLSSEEFKAARQALDDLGYLVGPDPILISAGAVREFQRDHGLTVDGILGRATLSTLQRRMDAKRKAVPAAGATAASGVGAANDSVDALAGVPWAGVAVLVLAAFYAAWLAYTYRDAIAAKARRRLPGLARFLRSF